VANAYENVEVLKDPRVSSLLNTSFKDLPPCLFIVADLDPLRDENLGMKL
jgi:acetyl esterase/lipase